MDMVPKNDGPICLLSIGFLILGIVGAAKLQKFRLKLKFSGIWQLRGWNFTSLATYLIVEVCWCRIVSISSSMLQAQSTQSLWIELSIQDWPSRQSPVELAEIPTALFLTPGDLSHGPGSFHWSFNGRPLKLSTWGMHLQWKSGRIIGETIHQLATGDTWNNSSNYFLVPCAFLPDKIKQQFVLKFQIHHLLFHSSYPII